MPELIGAEKKGILTYLPVIGIAICIFTMAHFIPRYYTTPLLGIYGASFAFYILAFRQKEKWSVSQIIFTGAFLRLIIFDTTPWLSEDVYRFLWDGKLWLNGTDPFAFIPKEAMAKQLPGTSEALYEQLNSPTYFTIYPPTNQLLFTIAALLPVKGGVLLLRSFILLAEMLTLTLLPKALKKWNINPKVMLLYAFNPLIIIELTGNLHFEAFVVLFLVLSLSSFAQNRFINSSVFMGLAASFKLIPLVLLPSLFKSLSFKKLFAYYLLTMLILAVTIVPLLNSQLLSGIQESGTLYFKKFEFNASIYYIVREIGFWLKGYNIIGSAGPVLALCTFIGIIGFNLLAPKTINVAERMLWSWSIFCFFSLTVHPWYCIPLIALSLFTQFRFPVLWSLLIFLSYVGYTVSGFSENLWLTSLEYILLFGFIVWEVRSEIVRTTDNA